MKKIIINIVILLIVIGILFIWLSNIQYTDYWAVVGRKYEQIYEIMGKPIYIIDKKIYKELHYDSITYYCAGTLGWVKHVTIEDKNIRFGIFNIGIGSNKSLIKKVYFFKKKKYNGIYDGQDIIGIQEGFTIVNYEFDEEGKVKRIYLNTEGI